MALPVGNIIRTGNQDTSIALHRRVVALLLSLLFFCMPFVAYSQTSQEPRITNPVEVKEEHNPNRALLLSAVLPGAGQVYNKQWWKVPIVYVAIGGIGYVTYNNFSQMKYYRDEYLYRVANNGQTQYPDNPDMVATPTSNIYNMYEAYNKTFQLSVIVSIAVYGINLLDAYVFGHLFEFQISDDLSMNMSPSLMPSSVAPGSAPFLPAASLSLRF